jgi:hypothetical protein
MLHSFVEEKFGLIDEVSGMSSLVFILRWNYSLTGRVVFQEVRTPASHRGRENSIVG